MGGVAANSSLSLVKPVIMIEVVVHVLIKVVASSSI